ncbi:MAG: hypothetical protein V7642_6202 [Burkholderiales bacterium]|jgi:ketosteroid isomerase-like protein
MRSLTSLRATLSLLAMLMLWLPYLAHASRDDDAARDILQALEDATNRRATAGILALAAEDIVMASKNGQIVRGKLDLAAYLDKMFGMVPTLKGLRTRVILSEPVVRQGNVLVAHGTSNDEYAFTDGLRFAITTVWSATLVEDRTGWKVAAVHFSFDLFDNPLLNAARKTAWAVALLAILFGALLGAILERFSIRQRAMP